MIVALALVALLATLVGPQFLAARPSIADDPSVVLARARRLAVERGQPMRLMLARGGAWQVTTLHEPDVVVLAGQLPAPQLTGAIDVSATGLCIPEGVGAWDPSRCAPTASSSR